METNTPVLLGITGIGIVLILAIIIIGIPFLNNTPPATSCTSSEDSGSVLFISDVYGTEDALTFRYVPKDAKPGTYLASYEIYENGAVVRTEQDREYTGISPETPLMITVSRQRNATYTMDMRIRKNGASCPYQSRVSIATGNVK